MNYLNIKVPPNTKIAVCGDIHGHLEQFNRLLDIIKPSHNMWFFSAGDVMEKGFGPEAENSIVDSLRNLATQGIGGMTKGNHELKVIREARKANVMTPQLQWCDSQPLAMSFVFTNGTRLTILHGGVNPDHTLDSLSEDVEICYIRTVTPGKSKSPEIWHHLYDGRLGYIISGHNSQKDGIPKFYNFSCNIDTSVYTTGKLTAQVFSENGREELISITGPIFKEVHSK